MYIGAIMSAVNITTVSAYIKYYIQSLAAWCSGHRIRLRKGRPGFESRQGLSFLGKHSQVYNRLYWRFVFNLRNKGSDKPKKTTYGVIV
jgi:hypothetical protein